MEKKKKKEINPKHNTSPKKQINNTPKILLVKKSLKIIIFF